MAYKTLIFGVDDMFNELQPYYAREVKRGNLEIVAYADFEDGKVTLIDAKGRPWGGIVLDFELVIISAHESFYKRIKQLAYMNIPSDKIIDGRVFQMPNLDFSRFLAERIAYGVLKKNTFEANSRMIYPKVYTTKGNKITLSLGIKSYIRKNSSIEGRGIIALGKFSSFAPNQLFSLGQNLSHNYNNVGTVPKSSVDWVFPKKFYPSRGKCKILIGNDVWCGRGCIFKSTNPKKPLVIGDGAVIASDSVVVKNVPSYAIVGGNPAQIIKFRFSEDVIESLLRIKWWDWSLDKIHDNFKYFNDVERFISLHDK